MLRDVALSFCPASFRSLHRASSPSRVLLGAVLTGALQTFLFAKAFFAGYVSFLVLRGHQLVTAVQQMNQTTQAWFVVMLSIESLAFHPVGLLCAYLALEGFVRFAGGLSVSEAVPSFPVTLAIKAGTYVKDKRTQPRLRPLSAIPTRWKSSPAASVCGLPLLLLNPNGTGAGRSASTANGMKWSTKNKVPFLERTCTVLRRAPLGKVLRACEEYDLTAAVKLGEGAKRLSL